MEQLWQLSLASVRSALGTKFDVARALSDRSRRTAPSLVLRFTVALASEARFLAVVAAAVLAAGLPLLQLQEMSGHDTYAYLPRNVEFFRALADGQLVPRWAPDLDGGYGQPLFLFNPPLIYYVSALFHALGASFVGAEDLAILALLATGVLGVYVLARGYLGRWGAVAAAAGYAFAEPVLVTLYVRHALADFAGCAVLPWALWGVLYATTRRGRWALAPGAAATALLLLASNPVALLAAPFLAGAVLWAGARSRSLVALGRGLAGLALGCGLSAFFWLPALAERREVHLERLLVGWLRYTNHFVWPHQLVFSPWGYGISVPGPHDGMSLALGLAQVGAVVLGLGVLAWRVRPPLPWVGPALVLVLAASFLTTSLAKWLWDALPLLQVLQFPWRALVLCALGSALLCGLPVVLVERRFPRLAGAACAAMLVLLLWVELPHAHPQQMLAADEAAYTPAALAARVVVSNVEDEYEPADVTQEAPRPARGPAEVAAGYAAIRELSRNSVSLHLAVQALQPTRLLLHTAFFPGWRLEVDGHERPILHDIPQGLMQVDLTPGNHDLWLRFGSTPLRTAAALVSALAALLLAAGWPRRRWIRRRNDSQMHVGDLQRDPASARPALELTGSASSFGTPSEPLRYSGAGAWHHLPADENEGTVQR